MPKPSVKIAIAAQLGSNPTFFDAPLVALQSPPGEIFRQQSLEDCFGGQHPALNCRMNSLQARSVQKATAVANYQDTVSVKLWHRMPATGCNCFRPVSNHLAALKQSGHEWMRLKSLKF